MKQRGVVLIMVLVLLLAVTLLGTVVVQNTTLQTKMVSNTQARQQAFNSAEAVLAYAENWLATHAPTDAATINAQFKSDCTGGLCYRGGPLAGGLNSEQNCSLGATPEKELWEKGGAVDVWHTDKHATFTPPDSKEGMYIIEFRCFVDGAGKVYEDAGDMLFRITARGISSNGESVVMVQSTYRVGGYAP